MAAIRLERITKTFGQVTALNDVSFDVADGEFFTLLGPPGAGKTTTLRTIVGLEKPDQGDVYLGDERVTDTWPGDRDIAIVFQNLALYPDKTVFNNLAFPLKQRKMPKAEIRQRVEKAASTLHIEHLLKRKPAKLSGGERQRVALGRAIVREPQAFLFDEPISALDALLRIEMRTELKRLQRELGRTLVYVTHDQVEAMSMSDRIAVLREGEIQQIDMPETIYHRPTNRFVATVVGSPPMNFIPASARFDETALHLSHPLFEASTSLPGLPGSVIEKLRAADCWIGIRPEDVEITVYGDTGIPATVYVTEPLGGETVVDLQFGDRVIKALAPSTLQLVQDQAVRASLDATRLHVFTDEGEAVVSAAGDDIFTLSVRAQ
jgi:multiple sugar transport system ATP-binding protein